MTLSPSAQLILEKRYLRKTESTWDDLSNRVGMGVGNMEYGTAYADMVRDMFFIAGGRINRNVGRSRGSLFNCYNLPIGDSREEIGELYKNANILWGEGGGVGTNFSTLRPRGADIKGVGGKSSGLVSFMRAVDGIAATIESGGQRRAASLGLCEVWHPEIERFIDAKRKEGDISYFNISVGVSESFIDCVRQDKPWPLHFNKLVERDVSSLDLWGKIIQGMVDNGEPGLINMSNFTRNNSYYFAPITGTNPCGETCLEDYGVCNLGSLVLPKFVANTRMKWSKLEEVIRLAIRFLDTCIDLNKYSLDRVKRTAIRGRRVGLGVMGLGDMLFALNLRYGSRDAIDFIEKLFKFIRNISYDESIALASEKGAFPAFDANLYCKSKFVRTLAPSMRQSIRKHGVRNVTLLAMAPTGTISLIPEVTSGIEPLMYKAYERKDRVSTRQYVHKLYESAKDEPWFVDSTDLTPQEHVDTQIAIQKYTDGAVSKTIVVPNDYGVDDLSELLLESIDDLKGVTVYREGSREQQIITPITNPTLDATHEADVESVSCAKGTCEL